MFARFHGKSPLPDKKAFIEKCLNKFDVNFAVQDYEVKAPGEPHCDEYGTAFVYGHPSEAVLYIEDKRVLRIVRETDLATQQTVGTL